MDYALYPRPDMHLKQLRRGARPVGYRCIPMESADRQVDVLGSFRTAAPRCERTFQAGPLCSLGYSPDSTVKGMLLI
jgi:hypothetical protein